MNEACEPVPGLLHGSLVLLPEGLLIGCVGEASAYDREPLIRAATRCLGTGAAEPVESDFLEYVLIVEEQTLVFQRGRRFPELALLVACSREPNVAFVLSSTRQALRALELCLDTSAWSA